MWRARPKNDNQCGVPALRTIIDESGGKPPHFIKRVRYK
jgi:hypothetical protein